MGDGAPAATPPEQDATRLHERLARLEAHEAVRELKHRYLRACDRKDVAAFRACFADGQVELDYGPLGTFDDADALTDVFARFARARDGDGYRILDMHHAVHPSITVTAPDEARGSWMLRFRQVDRRDRTERLGAIEYDDAYVRVDGAWRIRASRAVPLWSLTRPLPEGAVIEESIDG